MDPEVARKKQKENSLLVAYGKAAEILRASDPEDVCERTGATYSDGAYNVTFLGQQFSISVPDVVFVTEGALTIVEVLILHYLTTANDLPIKNEFISFNSIPNGMFYFASFKKRALDKVVALFGNAADRLMAAGAAIGGRKWRDGESATVIPVFPRIEVVVQVFEADEEFPAEANILYSDSVINYFPAEDTAFLGGWVVGALARAAG